MCLKAQITLKRKFYYKRVICQVKNNKTTKIFPVQCKSARAMLNWSQEELALKVECSKKTITDFEKGNRIPHTRIVRDIRIVFEEAGIVFINNGEIGVKMNNKFNN